MFYSKKELARCAERLRAAKEANKDVIYVDGVAYGVHQVCFSPEKWRVSGREWPVIAWDECGNPIVVDDSNGEILWLDHETDETVKLAPNLTELAPSLVEYVDESEASEPVVESAWIDPEFFEELKRKGEA